MPNNWRAQAREHRRAKIAVLVGGVIEDVGVAGDELESLVVRMPSGRSITVGVWADDECNHPGSLLVGAVPA